MYSILHFHLFRGHNFMKKTLIPLFFILCCSSLLFLLLIYSKECIALASNGLLIWFHKMIPTLFPFMVLSGFLVRSGLSYKLGNFLRPILGILLPLPSHMLYVVFMGFLCGFPMGAKIVADMIDNKQITKKEGQYLLSFCNNIGPLYMLGYVIPLFQYSNTGFILILMYSVPILFGLFSYFRLFSPSNYKSTKELSLKNRTTEIMNAKYTAKSIDYTIVASGNYLNCFQESLSSAIEQITLLGGCMVFFNTLLIIPLKIISSLLPIQSISHINYMQGIFCSLIEIGGGLQQFASITTDKSFFALSPYFIISLLTFGGLSCILQTFFIIKNTGLNIFTYIKHKTIQSCIYILLYTIFN